MNNSIIVFYYQCTDMIVSDTSSRRKSIVQIMKQLKLRNFNEIVCIGVEKLKVTRTPIFRTLKSSGYRKRKKKVSLFTILTMPTVKIFS